MSFLGFRPALHVPLGSRVDVDRRVGGALRTIVPASGAACPTVVDGQLQALVVGTGGLNGAGWWHMGWCGGAGSGASSASASAASSSSAAPAGSLRLQVSDELGVHNDELCRETFHRGRELGDGGAIASRGCRQVRDVVHHLLL